MAAKINNIERPRKRLQIKTDRMRDQDYPLRGNKKLNSSAPSPLIAREKQLKKMRFNLKCILKKMTLKIQQD